MAKSAFLDSQRFAPFADPVPGHLSSLLSFCKKVLTAAEEKRVSRISAVAAHSVDVKLIVAPQEELSRHDATAASSAPGIAERYAPTGGNTWHIRGDFREFSGYFWQGGCAMMRADAAGAEGMGQPRLAGAHPRSMISGQIRYKG